MSEFTDWLQIELAHRNWTRSELARRAGLSVSAVSMVLSGQRTASPETCTKLAIALDLPPELVFRRAGHLPQTASQSSADSGPAGHQPRTEAERAAFRLYQQLKELPPDDQERVFDLMERLRGDRGVGEADHVPMDADC